MDRQQTEKFLEAVAERFAKSKRAAINKIAQELSAIEPARSSATSNPCCEAMEEEYDDLLGNLEQAQQMRQDYLDSGLSENSPPVHQMDHIILIFEAQIDILETISSRCCP